MRKCKDCGNEEVVERKRCKGCARIFNAQRAKEYYQKQKSKGIVLKRYGVSKCAVCNEDMVMNHPNQIAHSRCRHKTVTSYNDVKRVGTTTEGRWKIKNLGFKLSANTIVHHLDETPSNNDLSNLALLSRANHSALHRFLQQQWSLYMKVYSKHSENCWDILRDQLTTTWLEMAGVNVIKITDIGQSAAEPLNLKDNVYIFQTEEGSETMY